MEHICEQYSDEWVRLRLGKPTASGFHHIITAGGVPTKGLTRRKYLYRLVAERLLMQAMDDSHESKWMRRGAELEQEAAVALRAKVQHIHSIRKTGFFTALNGRACASPDGMVVNLNGVTNNEAVEIKCPAPYTHVGYLIDGLGADYKPQMQGQMWVTGATLVHFWSWHPSMPPVYEKFPRDGYYIGKLAAAVKVFCDEVDDAEAHCRGMGSFRLAEKLRLSDEMAGDMAEVL